MQTTDTSFLPNQQILREVNLANAANDTSLQSTVCFIAL